MHLYFIGILLNILYTTVPINLTLFLLYKSSLIVLLHNYQIKSEL